MAETKAEFRSRVLAQTGLHYRDIPMVEIREGALPGSIICKRGQVYVCECTGEVDDNNMFLDPEYVRVHLA